MDFYHPEIRHPILDLQNWQPCMLVKKTNLYLLTSLSKLS